MNLRCRRRSRSRSRHSRRYQFINRLILLIKSSLFNLNRKKSSIYLFFSEIINQLNEKNSVAIVYEWKNLYLKDDETKENDHNIRS